MNLSQNSWKRNHEASDGQKSDVGSSVPVVSSDQSAPVVQPAMAPFYLPATLAGFIHLSRTAQPATAVRQFSMGDGRLNSPPPQFMPEVSALIALVSAQAG